MTITAKIKIDVTAEQQDIFKNTVAAYTKACNYVSAIVFKTKELVQARLHKLTYHDLRSNYEMKSQMAQSVMKTVIARYKTNKSNGHEWNLVIFKKPELDLVWNRDYSLTKNQFSVNSLNGRLKVDYYAEGMEKYFSEDWSFGTAKLVNKYGKWFLHIPMSKEVKVSEEFDINQVVGIDFGINFTATAYDSQGKTTFFNGREIKDKRAKYKRLRRDLQRKQTPSARRRLKRIGQRENRWMSDVNHCISKALVMTYGEHTLFVLEDLTGVRNATEKVFKKGRYEAVSWSFFQLRQKLEYKAKLSGSKTIVVDPKYTSQTCPKCGHTEKENRNKKKHSFECKSCGYKSNDDRIAAMNLQRKGIEYIVEVTTQA